MSGRCIFGENRVCPYQFPPESRPRLHLENRSSASAATWARFHLVPHTTPQSRLSSSVPSFFHCLHLIRILSLYLLIAPTIIRFYLTNWTTRARTLHIRPATIRACSQSRRSSRQGKLALTAQFQAPVIAFTAQRLQAQLPDAVLLLLNEHSEHASPTASANAR